MTIVNFINGYILIGMAFIALCLGIVTKFEDGWLSDLLDQYLPNMSRRKAMCVFIATGILIYPFVIARVIWRHLND